MKKAIYKPTNQNIIIVSETGDHIEIFINGEYRTVAKDDVELFSEITTFASLKELKRMIYLNCHKNPLSNILYSFNSNRLIPKPHQYKPLIKYLNSENNRILIADEVGLGKTIEAGMIFKEIQSREDLRISLIVVPSSLTYKWKEELNIRFDEYFEIKKTNEFLQLIDEFEDFHSSKLFNEKIIISYHTLRDERVIKRLTESLFEVDFLVMDEAHTMRNRGTSTFDSAEVITSLSDHILFLTATPVQNKLLDLFNILYLLDEDYFMDYDYFEWMISPNRSIHHLVSLIRGNQSITTIKESSKKIIEQENNEFIGLKQICSKLLIATELSNENKIKFIDDLQKLDHLSFIINRTKKKDVGRLIPRNANSIIVDISNQEKDYYSAVIGFVKLINPGVPQGFITIMPERMASSSMIASLQNFKVIRETGKIYLKNIDDLDYELEEMDLRNEALEALDFVIEKGNLIGNEDSKFLKFIEILTDLQNQGIKQAIIFSFFKYSLNYLETKLRELDYKVGKIHGDFTVEERYNIIKSFKSGNFDLLLSSEVGSEGLDMQFCNVIINYDLPWNPMRVEQRIGRIDRIGQKFEKLHIFNLCISGSIEDRIFMRLYEKLNIFEGSIGELEPILGDLEQSLDISSMINLSQKEIDEILHLKALSIKRGEIEIVKQEKELEKLLYDDFENSDLPSSIINNNKRNTLQEQTKEIVIDFLKENEIGFVDLKENSIKITGQYLKKFLTLLKANMSDKKIDSSNYMEERTLLQRIHKQKELALSFSPQNDSEFNTMFVGIGSSLLKLLLKDKKPNVIHAILSSSQFSNSYAVIYRIDFTAIKAKSVLETLVFNNDLSIVEHTDYFDFINKCSYFETAKFEELNNLKTNANHYIIEREQAIKERELETLNSLIDIKVKSITQHFEKQISRAHKIEMKVSQADVKRMRVAEVSNLKEQLNEKIQTLNNQKKITSSYEILGFIKIA